MKAYREIRKKDARKEKPIYRKKTWRRNEREKDKRTKKTGWYKKGGFKSIIFVPATPGSVLKKRYDNILKESKLNIKAVERSGTKLKNLLSRNNPFEKNKCREEDECFVCTTGKGNCKKENVTYKLECKRCKYVYVGESARTGNYRGNQHIKLFRNRHKDSVLYKHLIEHHDTGYISIFEHFKMSIIGRYKTALERQISEAIKIDNIPSSQRMNTKEEWGHSKIITSLHMT